MRVCLVHVVRHPSYALVQRSGPGDNPTQLEGYLWVLLSPHALYTMYTTFWGQRGFFVWCFVFFAGQQMPPLPHHQVVALILHCGPVLYSLSLLQYIYMAPHKRSPEIRALDTVFFFDPTVPLCICLFLYSELLGILVYFCLDHQLWDRFCTTRKEEVDGSHPLDDNTCWLSFLGPLLALGRWFFFLCCASVPVGALFWEI